MSKVIMADLSVVQVGDWVASHAPSYETYRALFTENGINGRGLLMFDDPLLERLGVEDPIHRRQLLADIQSFRTENGIIMPMCTQGTFFRLIN